MKQELREDPEPSRSLPRELPQSFALDVSSETTVRGHLSAGEQVKEEILTELRSIMGCADEDLEVLPLPALNSFKGRAGFRIIDQRAVAHGRNDEIEIASVLLLKSRRDRNTIVPIVIPHRHPDAWGARLREQIDSEYTERFGMPPLELIKSRTRAWVERSYEWIRETPGRTLTALAVGISIMGLGIWSTTSTVQSLQESRAAVSRQLEGESNALRDAGLWLSRAQQAETLPEQLKNIDGMFDDGTLGYSKVTETLTKRLASPEITVAREALEVTRDILRIDLQRIDDRPPLPPLRGSRDGRALLEEIERQAPRVKDPQLRAKFDEVLKELQALKGA